MSGSGNKHAVLVVLLHQKPVSPDDTQTESRDAYHYDLLQSRRYLGPLA